VGVGVVLAVGVELAVGVREAVSEGTNVLVIMMRMYSTRESDKAPFAPEQAANKITNRRKTNHRIRMRSLISINSNPG
jgi:hypothetical protein